MTEQEFTDKYRCHLLGIIADGWGSRHLPPSDFGRTLDGHYRKLEIILRQMWKDTQVVAKEANNGKAPPVRLVANGG